VCFGTDSFRRCTDVWYVAHRRAADAIIETAIGCHSFRATGITDCLTNGGRIEVALRMAGTLER
jgi:integrase/recombinase XerD